MAIDSSTEQAISPNGLTAQAFQGAPLPEETKLCREGAPWPRQVLMLAALVALAIFLLQVIGSVHAWALHRMEVLVTLGGIACWRWSWFVIQNIRAMIYRYHVFPRLRRDAHRAIAQHGPVREVTVLATTYHEKPWITQAVFESIYREMSTIEGLERRPRLIVVTGCDQDDQNIRAIHAQASAHVVPNQESIWPPELVLLRGDKGKRPALATGMEEIARGQPSPDGVVVILDGDTMFGPGLFQKVLPLFRLTPTVDAITTNENNLVKGPAWFAEWTSLRFGLRHRSMCSISLSGKLLCLTGRFSVFRASVVIDPGFRSQVEHDVINHWLWGSFEMLSGDDKSTWYWLAANGKRMLYVPDAMVTTFEVITGSSLKRAMANIRRWSGNSVRHSWRAMMLGPRKLSWFAWWSLLDQRLTMLTVLFGPTVAILGICAGQYELVAGYFLWVMCSRVSHASIAWRQGRRFSAYYIPLQILSDWSTALTKLWVVFHPAKQNWMNRGARSLNTTTGSAFYGLRTGFAHYLYGFTCASLIVAIGLFVGFFPVLRHSRLYLNSDPATTARGDASERGTSSLQTEPWPLAGELGAVAEPASRVAATTKPAPHRRWMAVKFLGKPADDKQPKQFEPASHE